MFLLFYHKLVYLCFLCDKSVPSKIRPSGQMESACHPFLYHKDKAACNVLLMLCCGYQIKSRNGKFKGKMTILMSFIEINWTRHTNSENVRK